MQSSQQEFEPDMLIPLSMLLTAMLPSVKYCLINNQSA